MTTLPMPTTPLPDPARPRPAGERGPATRGAAWHTSAAEEHAAAGPLGAGLPAPAYRRAAPEREGGHRVRVCEETRERETRERVERHPWYELAPRLRVTVSVGVAHAFGPTAGIDELVATADTLLYAAKTAGRNAVAYQDPRSGLVRLAGPAADRRAIPQPLLPTPTCRPGPTAP